MLVTHTTMKPKGEGMWRDPCATPTPSLVPWSKIGPRRGWNSSFRWKQHETTPTPGISGHDCVVKLLRFSKKIYKPHGSEPCDSLNGNKQIRMYVSWKLSAHSWPCRLIRRQSDPHPPTMGGTIWTRPFCYPLARRRKSSVSDGSYLQHSHRTTHRWRWRYHEKCAESIL